MTERDPLTVVAEELPKLADSVKKLKHPMLELLLDRAEAELTTLAGSRHDQACLGARQDTPQQSQESGTTR
ncbi:hypothetical protein ACWIGM_03385 [Bosea sp. NPDC055332]